MGSPRVQLETVKPAHNKMKNNYYTSWFLPSARKTEKFSWSQSISSSPESHTVFTVTECDASRLLPPSVLLMRQYPKVEHRPYVKEFCFTTFEIYALPSSKTSENLSFGISLTPLWCDFTNPKLAAYRNEWAFQRFPLPEVIRVSFRTPAWRKIKLPQGATPDFISDYITPFCETDEMTDAVSHDSIVIQCNLQTSSFDFVLTYCFDILPPDPSTYLSEPFHFDRWEYGGCTLTVPNAWLNLFSFPHSRWHQLRYQLQYDHERQRWTMRGQSASPADSTRGPFGGGARRANPRTF